MSTPCDDVSKVYCEEQYLPLRVYTRNTSGIEHTKNLTEHLPSLDLVLWSRERAFTLHGTETDYKNDGYWLNRVGGTGPVACYDHQVVNDASVSEHYRTIDSSLIYLDLRTDIRVYKTVTETIDFYCQSAETAAFKTVWGNVYPHKLKVVSAPKTKVILYTAVIGAKTEELKLRTINSNRHSDTNPLILIYPNPPSQADPLDADVKKYGFYDYNADSWDGLAKDDGGKDYYYPEWCRELGVDNSRDYRLRDARFNVLLTLPQDRTDSTMGESVILPGHTFPTGNCAISREGDTLLSFLVDETEAINRLYNKDGQLIEFLDLVYKEGGGKTLIYPVIGL